jgi:hypothetical protein
MDRRTTLKWVMAAAAAVPGLNGRAWGAVAPEANAASDARAAGLAADRAAGYGTDPDLSRVYHPGELWPLTLSAAERRTATVLCDLILPADERSPSASSVGVVDFLDEWVSAPYPQQQADRPILLAGLKWLDDESARRFATTFAALDEAGQRAICDDICHEQTAAAAAFAEAAHFFARYRDLTAGGFYTTPEGRRDIGYVGNVPQATFEGPPLELLRMVGLAE